MHRSNYIGRTSTERKQQKLYNSVEERQQIDIVAKKKTTSKPDSFKYKNSKATDGQRRTCN